VLVLKAIDPCHLLLGAKLEEFAVFFCHFAYGLPVQVTILLSRTELFLLRESQALVF
jgi:hypothetical protein